MKPGQGKNKGSGYEREVGRKISLWISKGTRPDLLCRTVLSGGQFTMASTGNAGDLMAQHPLAFPFFAKCVVECKSWRDLQLIRFMYKEGDLYKALLKVQMEAEKVGKTWWLICKQNHSPTLLFMSAPDCPTKGMCSYHAIFNGLVLMVNLDEFLAAVPHDLYTDNVSRFKE